MPSLDQSSTVFYKFMQKFPLREFRFVFGPTQNYCPICVRGSSQIYYDQVNFIKDDLSLRPCTLFLAYMMLSSTMSSQM
jgi:hypothetical protein